MGGGGVMQADEGFRLIDRVIPYSEIYTLLQGVPEQLSKVINPDLGIDHHSGFTILVIREGPFPHFLP